MAFCSFVFFTDTCTSTTLKFLGCSSRRRRRRRASLSQMTRAIQSTSSLLFDYDRLALNQKGLAWNTTPLGEPLGKLQGQHLGIKSNYKGLFLAQKCRSQFGIYCSWRVCTKMNYGPFAGHLIVQSPPKMQLLVRRWDDHWELQEEAKNHCAFQMHRADTFQML